MRALGGRSRLAAAERVDRAWFRGRIVGLDMARWFALVGMIATHALATTGPDGRATVVQSVAAGRASALFAVLAGVSMALMSGGPRPVTGRDLRAVRAGLLVRAVLIGTIGMLLAELGSTIAVILTYYAVLFMLGLPFLRLRARTLAVLAGLWAVAGPVLSWVVRPTITSPDLGNPQAADLAQPGDLLVTLVLTGWYPACTWLAYLLLGLAVGRSLLDRARTALVLVGSGAALAVAASVLSEWLLDRPGAMIALGMTLASPPARPDLASTLDLGLTGTTPTGSAWWLAIDAPHSGTPLDLAQAGGSALAVIGACLLVSRVAPRACAVGFGAGAMPLTLYTLHVILRSPDLLDGDDPTTFWLHVGTVTVIGAWFRLVGLSGPLERLVAITAGAVRRRVAGVGTGSQAGLTRD